MNTKPKKCIIILSAAYPFGRGETFLEKELPYLLRRFARVYILPMFSNEPARVMDKRIILLSSTPPSTLIINEFFRGIFSSGQMFFSEWRQSPGYPLSISRLFLIARTLGIAGRIKDRILQTIHDHKLKNGIIYSYWMNQACIGGILAAQKSGWPVVSRAHGGDLYTERHPAEYLPWHEWKVQKLDYIFPVSNHGKAYLTNRYPDALSKVQLHRLGVTGSTTIKHTPGGNDTFHIASCSSVIPLKRVERILETVVELKKRLGARTVRWTHFGSGPAFDALKRLADNARVSGLEIALKGHVANDKIPFFYSTEKVDLFINYSISEGIPVSIMEALSCGLPAAAPAVGGIPEIVSSSNGILFDSNITPQELADCIQKTLDSGKFGLMGESGKKEWAQNYSVENNYKRFATFLTDIVH